MKTLWHSMQRIECTVYSSDLVKLQRMQATCLTNRDHVCLIYEHGFGVVHLKDVTTTLGKSSTDGYFLSISGVFVPNDLSTILGNTFDEA